MSGAEFRASSLDRVKPDGSEFARSREFMRLKSVSRRGSPSIQALVFGPREWSVTGGRFIAPNSATEGRNWIQFGVWTPHS